MPVIASDSGGLGEIVERGVRGLLFPNGDADALLDRLLAVASGSAFPEHTLPDEVVHPTVAASSMDRHIRHMRQVFGEVVARSAGKNLRRDGN